MQDSTSPANPFDIAEAEAIAAIQARQTLDEQGARLLLLSWMTAGWTRPEAYAMAEGNLPQGARSWFALEPPERTGLPPLVAEAAWAELSGEDGRGVWSEDESAA